MLNRRGKLPDLTSRQVEVLAARARGERWDSIAERLNIVTKTAEGHLKAVSTKMAWFLRDAMLDHDASAGDIERALGLSPGDLLDPDAK
jgi:FixJ family two-component response regulator